MALGAIAVDPNNPSTIYAGTGEAFPASIATYGVGILKSIDGGNTWTNIQGPFVPYGGGGMDIAAIAVSPQNTNIVLVAAPFPTGPMAAGGLYRSTDAGATWTSVQTTEVSAVAFDPNHPGVVFATSGAAGNAYVLRSTDSGATWMTVYTLSGTTEHTTLTIAPTDSTIYAAFSEYTSQVTLKSVDGGNTWKELTETVQISGQSLCTNQCSYNLVLAVSPRNSQEVYFGAISLVRTQDGGVTWYEMAANVHSDQHALVFSPAGDKLYVGDDGGVWSSTNPDAAVGTLAFSSLNNGLANLQFYRGISMAAGNPNLGMGGMQDNGTALYQGQSQWPHIWGGDGFATAIDPRNPQSMYATTQYGYIWHSLDGGQTFQQDMNGLTGTQSGFFTELAMDPNDSQLLYTENDNSFAQIFRTVDGSSVWEQAFANVPDGITSVNVSAADGNVVWVSTYGPLFVSTNATGAAEPTWTQVTLPTGRVVTNIVPDPHDPTVAYAAVSSFLSFLPDSVGHVVKVSTTGANWTNISASFPDIPANDIAVDPAIPNALYVATDVGVFATADGGTTWNSVGTGLPNSYVTGLALDAKTRILRAGTHGRGMWDLQLPTPPAFTVSPGSVTFVSQTINTTSAAQIISVTNISNASMTLASAVVSGPFAETDNCGAALPAASACSYNVTFTPTSAGAQTGSLTVSNSSGGPSQAISLSGTGAVIVTPSFSISAVNGSSTSQTVTAGQTATYNLVAARSGGFSDNVTLTCNGAPTTTTCTVSPSSFAFSGSASVSLVVTVTTVSRTSAALPFGLFDKVRPRRFFVLAMLLALIAAMAGKRRSFGYAWQTCFLAVALMGLSSCGGVSAGGSGASNPVSQPQSSGTPAGTYQLVVTGSAASASSSLNLSLTVK